jgi:hypothetical protein
MNGFSYIEDFWYVQSRYARHRSPHMLSKVRVVPVEQRPCRSVPQPILRP